MSLFRSPLKIEQIEGGYYRLLDALIFESDHGYGVTVRAGFITDGASVPPLLRPIAAPFAGSHAAAAVIHDALYSVHVTSRHAADSLFYDAMRAAGVGLIRRYLLFLGVCIGGAAAWCKPYEFDQAAKVRVTYGDEVLL